MLVFIFLSATDEPVPPAISKTESAVFLFGNAAQETVSRQ